MKIFGRQQNMVSILALSFGITAANESTTTPPTTSQTSSALRTISQPRNATCGFRTINYITHSLPQACLRYPRSDLAGPESTTVISTEGDITVTGVAPSGTLSYHADAASSVRTDINSELDSESALDEASFLSFEDWKRRTLEKEGLSDLTAGDRRQQVVRDIDQRRNSDGIQEVLNVLEEDVDMETDFTAFLGEGREPSQSKASLDEDDLTVQTSQDVADDKSSGGRPRYRSKDVGKTCKERSNFASLDAGAQVMKTNPEAKSTAALLKEDRDVYMLNTCQAKNKFIIVELSESILVETVAIANFEFFSSTFRQFRISVSDRYPTKLDRWVDLGIFEATNSRDVQAFLVDDPRIWARYFRVEFLSHYGNEFYCPISLLRVHGRTMIEDVNMEESTRREDGGEDDTEELIESSKEKLDSSAASTGARDEKGMADGLKEVEAAIEDLVRTAEAITSHKVQDALNSSQQTQVENWLKDISMDEITTPWNKSGLNSPSLFSTFRSVDVCLLSDYPASHMMQPQNPEPTTLQSPGRQDFPKVSPTYSNGHGAIPDSAILSTIESELLTEYQDTPVPHLTVLTPPEGASGAIANTVEFSSSQPVVSSGIANPSGNGGEKTFSKSSTTLTSQISQPSTQESFFKTVTKRLQLLEANSTLSLKYIEEQSRILRDAFMKVERRQLAKTTSFLENLNDTVLVELRRFGQQYDQIWQSTVMELETQRDQSQREISAVSTRLSILADELVFQKRMSIAQSILLLLCLGLVVLSRGLSYLDQNLVRRSRNASDVPLERISSSLRNQRVEAQLERTPWLGDEHTRHISNQTPDSLRAPNPEISLHTPFLNDARRGQQPREDEDDFRSLRKDQGNLMEGTSQKLNTTRPAENYTDFKNSALWLAADSGTSVSEHREGEKETTKMYPNYICGPAEQSSDEQEADTGPGSHLLQSNPPEMEKPEFSITRKPLPAIPRDDH